MILNVLGYHNQVIKNKTTKNYPYYGHFYVKYDGSWHARLVAGGNISEELEPNFYSRVVEIETIRIAFVASALMKPKIIAADVGSAYIKVLTRDKYFQLQYPILENGRG